MKSAVLNARPLPTAAEAALLPSEVAVLLGISSRTLEGMRFKGEGPPYFRISRVVRYRRGDLDAWITARRVDPSERHGAGNGRC